MSSRCSIVLLCSKHRIRSDLGRCTLKALPIILLSLITNESLEIRHEWGNDIELVGIHHQLIASAFGSMLLALCRQVGKSEPLDFADLFPGLRHEVVVHGHTTEDKQLHVLLPNGLLERLDTPTIWDQASGIEIEARLFPCLADGTIEIVFVFVDLASGKTPRATLLPAFDQQDLVHFLVQENGASHGYAILVLYEDVEGIGQLFLGRVLKERTSLGDALKEGP